MNTTAPRRAVIDVGSNSILLLVAQLDHGLITKVLLEKTATTRLGKNLDATGKISDHSQQMSVTVIEDFISVATKLGVEKQNILIVGTEALRKAKNNTDFCEKINKKCGLHLKIITPEEEALAAWAATGHLFKPTEFPRLVFDIGGGSTEFLFQLSNTDSLTIQSLPLGCVRISEDFSLADTIENNSLHQGEKKINALLTAFFPETTSLKPLAKIVAVGGTATTLAAVKKKLATYHADSLHSTELTAEDIRHALTEFSEMDLSQRKKVIGLSPQRADVIVGGTLILNTILRFWDIHRFFVSTWGLRHGILMQL